MFLLHRKMKARRLEMFHEMKMKGKENFLKIAISLVVKEITWAEGPVHPGHCPLSTTAVVFTPSPGGEEGPVLRRAQGHLGCVGTQGGGEGTELRANKERRRWVQPWASPAQHLSSALAHVAVGGPFNQAREKTNSRVPRDVNLYSFKLMGETYSLYKQA